MKNLLFWLSRKIDYPLIFPEVMQISLTFRCQLKCKMCTLANSSPKEEELSTAQIFHVIDEARKNGIKEVLLTGGEPFLRQDLFEICGYIRTSGLRSIITTNGMIDKALIEDIGNSGINHIHFSIDGLQETHDFFRGEGTFLKTLDTIRALNQRRPGPSSCSTGIACTVMDGNVRELLKVVALADDLGVDVVNFQPVAKDNANFLDKNQPSAWVKKENIPILEEEIGKIRRYKTARTHIYEEPRLELLVQYYKGNLTPRDWVCFGGFKTAFICYSKQEPLVYSCHGICGNLEKIPFGKAWRSKEAYRLRRHSKHCRQLCLQSCYSKESAQSLSRITGFLRLSERRHGQ